MRIFLVAFRLEVTVSRLPPGTSKWVENRASLVLRHQPDLAWQALVSHEVVVKLIGATTTRTRLRVRAELDTNPYQAGRHIRDDELETMYLRKDPFNGEGTTR
jgi:hypothetical protein